MEKIPVNVQVNEANRQRILREEATWGPYKLIFLCGLLPLGAAIGLLYYLAHMPL